jgi:hypothetical protein
VVLKERCGTWGTRRGALGVVLAVIAAVFSAVVAPASAAPIGGLPGEIPAATTGPLVPETAAGGGASLTLLAPPFGGGSALLDLGLAMPGRTSPAGPQVAFDGFAYQPTVTSVLPSTGSASGGTSVHITGGGFPGGFKRMPRPPSACWVCAVRFGSVDATSFNVRDRRSAGEGEIEAVAPPGKGAVDVTVQTLAGTSSINPADQFTYEPAPIHAEFKNWALSGALTLKKLDQTIPLPPAARFDGSAELSPQTFSGRLSGSVALPPLEAVVKMLGIPATIGLEFSEVGSVDGSIEPSKNLAGDLTLSIPAKENISFTTIGMLGLQMSAKCHTSEPLSLPLLAELPAGELFATGAGFMGTSTIPPVKCEGSVAPRESALLSALFSGQGIAYAIAIAPPQ